MPICAQFNLNAVVIKGVKYITFIIVAPVIECDFVTTSDPASDEDV